MAPRLFTIQSAVDATVLHAYEWCAAPARAVVVIAHGAAEHSLRYGRFAAALNAAGFDVFAVDHRGHGATAPPGGLGDYGAGGWDGLVADFGQLVQVARDARPAIPIAVFGHSMGAAVAQQYVPEGSRLIDALVLSGSTARELPQPGDPPPIFAPNAPFEPGARTAYDWLSRDEAEVDRYIADPLCGFEMRPATTPRADPFVLADPVRLARIRPDLPCLFLAGDADPINRNLEGMRLLEERWRGAGVQRIDTLYYTGGRHEMLNETNRDEVTRDVIAWLGGALLR